jgi:hypothetical protein
VSVVSATRDALSKHRSIFGAYKLTGDYSDGRPVYVKDGSRPHYLLVADNERSWNIKKMIHSPGAYPEAGRGTISPAQPKAGPSVRLGPPAGATVMPGGGTTPRGPSPSAATEICRPW